MKGIAHFTTGVAVAALWPGVMQEALSTQTFWLAFGGLAGILPDTLDFKLARFFYKPDVFIDPFEVAEDPKRVAHMIAEAVKKAYVNGKCRVHFSSVKYSADLWRQWSFQFEDNVVKVKIAELVDTSGIPIPDTFKGEGMAILPVEVMNDYEGETVINIFSGPDVEFVRDGDKVRMVFLPWHRDWSHSLTLAVFLAFLLLPFSLKAAGIFVAAWWAHVLEDQLGYMGSNLFWPATTSRFAGLKLMHSSWPIPNALTVMLAAEVVLYKAMINKYPFIREDWHMFWFFFVVPVLLIITGAWFGEKAREFEVEVFEEGGD